MQPEGSGANSQSSKVGMGVTECIDDAGLGGKEGQGRQSMKVTGSGASIDIRVPIG